MTSQNGGDLARELAREQAHVSEAYARVETLRAEAAERERASLRASGAGSPQALYERDVTAFAAGARRAELDTAGEGLVFGRIDRRGGEVLHIGRIGVRTVDQEPLVVDWRAPAAAAFYQATAAAPRGVIRRRSIVCLGERVHGLEDDLLDADAVDELDGTVLVGDGAFLAAVSRERGEHMRDIVATVQAEQDVAVRAPDDGALVVTGGPGTGKTAVALHRVAYLMYARREFYARRGVLVVGPSAVFVNYIGQVLPALGETSVRLASLGDLPSVPRDTATDGYDAPDVATVKGSVRMVDFLRHAIRRLGTPRTNVDLDVTRWGIPLRVNAGAIARRREQIARAPRPHNTGRAAFAAALTELAWRTWERRPQATRLESDSRDDFAAWLRHHEAYAGVLDAFWPMLTPIMVLNALRGGALDVVEMGRGLFSDAELGALRRSWGHVRPEAPISGADAALLDELAEMLGEVSLPVDEDESDDPGAVEGYGEVTTFADRMRRPRRDLSQEEDYRGFAHLVVDEAQDVSPMQWRMLHRRGRGATWTIVGDWAQSAWPDVSEVRTAMADAVGRAPVRSAELTTNYRTSTEIAALAAELLAHIDPTATAPRAVRPTGVEPAFHDDVVAAATALLDQVPGTVGVVAPHARVEGLGAQLAALRSAYPRLSIVDTWQVKGLEYDGCVVVAPQDIVGEGLTRTAGLRSLYVALTRATQRLIVVGGLVPEMGTDYAESAAIPQV